MKSVRSRPGRDDLPYDFVPEDQRQFWFREFAIEHVQVGPTDPTSVDPDEDLPRTGMPVGDFGTFQGGAWAPQ